MTIPLVSLIVPCHNAETWFAATLESALAQTWTHREIIVVNDGSRDGSLAVANGFSSRGVTVVDLPNRGASAARNHGLRLSSSSSLMPTTSWPRNRWRRRSPPSPAATTASLATHLPNL